MRIEIRRKDIASLKDLIIEINQEGRSASENITKLTTKELQMTLLNFRLRQKLELLEFDVRDVEEVWKLLLNDGDNSLSIDKLTSGLIQIKQAPKSKDVLDILKRLKVVLKWIAKIELYCCFRHSHTLADSTECLDKQLDIIFKDVDDARGDIKRCIDGLEYVHNVFNKMKADGLQD